MDCKTVVEELRAGYGEKPEGLDEYEKKCTRMDPFVWPNAVPKYCVGYKFPEDIVLHELMLYGFFMKDKVKAKNTDFIIASYPKAGTTWMQEICYTVVCKGDLSKAKAKPLDQRMIFFEVPVGGIKAIDENEDDPRIFKTHLPFSLLPKNFVENKTKIIYIARNVKDLFVSYYFFYKNLIYVSYTGTMSEFMDHFFNNKLMYSSYADNVLSYWNKRHEDNIFFITYEQMQKDIKGGIKKISEFIGREITEEQLDVIVHHTSFEQMSKNPMTNYSTGSATCNETGQFMRKGKVGDWKNHLNEEMNRRLDDYIKKHFEGTGLEFEYEI